MRRQFNLTKFVDVLGKKTRSIIIVTYGGMSYRNLDHVAGQVCSLLGSPNDPTSYQILQELPLQLIQFFQTCHHWNMKIGGMKYIAVHFFGLYISLVTTWRNILDITYDPELPDAIAEAIPAAAWVIEYNPLSLMYH